MTSSIQIGEATEAAALHFLRGKGLTLISQNYRCQYGEIDLIMKDHDTLVFVEVRYRRHEKYGGSAMSITQKKQKKIINTAMHFLQNNQTDTASRFDVIAMSPSKAKMAYTIEWIQNAFI